MTFSILARDDSGAFGAAISSSSPAVSARCLWFRPGVGGATSQNITDPRLGPALLNALGEDPDAATALARVRANSADIDYRQLTLVDTHGRTAHFTGAQGLGVCAAATGDGVVAAGNLLANSGVPQSMVTAFEAASGDLESRLWIALAAGLNAGGEAGPVRSAGLAVVRTVSWRETDLRVDWHDEPIAELGRLLDVWLPQRDDYVGRALHPGAAPSFGVAGDV